MNEYNDQGINNSQRLKGRVAPSVAPEEGNVDLSCLPLIFFGFFAVPRAAHAAARFAAVLAKGAVRAGVLFKDDLIHSLLQFYHIQGVAREATTNKVRSWNAKRKSQM